MSLTHNVRYIKLKIKRNESMNQYEFPKLEKVTKVFPQMQFILLKVQEKTGAEEQSRI